MKIILGVLLALVPCTLGLLDANLGDACSSAADCAAAYSTCKSKKCACIDGFKESKGLCQPPAKQCPTFDCPPDFPCTFEPGKDCEHRVSLAGEESHTCNNLTEFCFIHPNEKTPGGVSVGHCCKRPPNGVANIKMVCPYKGTADPKGTCPDTSSLPADSTAPKSLTRTCSYVTQDCVRHFKQAACCPIPCHGASSHFSVEGKCYDYVQIGDACTWKVQCIGGSECIRAPSKSTGKGCFCPRGAPIDEPSPHCPSDGETTPTPTVKGGKTVDIGNECTDTAQCAGGSKCIRTPSAAAFKSGRACLCEGDTLPGPPKTCAVSSVAYGEPCSNTSQCATGFTCIKSPSKSTGRACLCDGKTNLGPPVTCGENDTQSVPIGKTCTDGYQCKDNGICMESGKSGKICMANDIPNGKPCNATVQCQGPNSSCAKSGSSPTGKVCIAS